MTVAGNGVEGVELAVVLLPHYVNFVDLCRYGPLTAPLDGRFDFSLFTFEDGFDRAIGVVLYPSFNVKAPGHPFRIRPEEDALDEPGNDDACTYLTHALN